MTININLLPWREALKEHHKREFLTILGAVVLASMALMLCVHTGVSREIMFQNENNNFLKNEIAKLDQKIIEIEKLEKEKKELLARMDIIQQLQANRPEVVELFDGLVRIVPPGLYLTNLARTGTHILIDGKAESNTRVSTFMRNIEATNWLKLPELSLIQAEDPSSTHKVEHLIGFNLQATEILTQPLILGDETKTNKQSPPK